MDSQKFAALLDQRVLVFDGAMGTRLYEEGIGFDHSFAELNMSRPELVEKIHREYVEAGADVLEPLGKQLAMHVAASKPQSVSRDDLDPAIAKREREFLAKQARASGKPEEIIEKIVEGQMRKFYEEFCLLDQIFVIDAETKVEKVLDAATANAGKPVSVGAFGLFDLGEGIEKKKEDFAAEVAAAIAD